MSTHRRLLILSLLLSGALATPFANAGIKCWTNKDGVRECGNAVPPEYAQQGHTVKDKQGLTRKTTTRVDLTKPFVQRRVEKYRQRQL